MRKMKDKRVKDELLADIQRDEILNREEGLLCGKKDTLAFRFVEFEVKVGYLRSIPERCEERG